MNKTIFLSILTFLFFYNAVGQIIFENGYFIDNSGNRTACLIKNQDWKNNPNSFEYRINENSDIQKATLTTVKEFSIPGQFKYVRFTVEIDKTLEKLDVGQLTYDPKPNYVKEELYLKVLVEGKASLYMYDADNLRKFFYTLENEVPEQLFFKRYKKSESTLASNNQYKQTLFLNLNCVNKTMEDEENLKYSANNLITYFEKYNKCENADFEILVDKTTNYDFNLNIKPRVIFSSLNIINVNNSIRSADFGSKTNFSAGIEAELALNFNKGTWSVFVEPAYFSFSADKEIQFQNVAIEYSFIEIPVGIRHYFFIDKKSKIFVNAAYVFYFNTDLKLEFEIPTSASTDFVSRGKLALGVGYNFNGKLSLEYRTYIGKKDIFNSGVYTSEFNYSSLILGYTLF